MHEEKLFVHTFHGIISIFLKTPTLFFFIFFRYHFHWYSIRYGNCLRWGSQQLDMNVNNKLNNYQNIIRADSENFFNGGGKGLQTLISRTQKLFAANYFLTTRPNLPPPPPCFTCSYTNISLSTKSADECRTDMWSCHGWWEIPFATEWPPHLWTIVITTLLIVARWAGLIRKGEGSAKNRAETMGKYSTDSEENWFPDTRSKRNSSQFYL